MSEPSDHEARIAALEARLDLGIEVDAHRAAINALGVQTAARFEQARNGSSSCSPAWSSATAGSAQRSREP